MPPSPHATAHIRPPTRETLSRLVRAAEALHRLAPWKWMHEEQVFAVQNPDTSDFGYCSVLGEFKEVYALIMYTGEEGLRWCQSTAGNTASAPHDRIDWMLDRSCLMADFVEPDELSPEDRLTLKSVGFTPRGRHAWPLFQHMSPGEEPWPPDEGAARFLATALEQAAIVCERTRKNENSLSRPEPNIYLTRTQVARDGQLVWEDRWLRHEPPADFVEAPPARPEALADLRRLASPRLGIWEADYFYSPGMIKPRREERGRYARMLMLADHDSGRVLEATVIKDTPAHVALRDLILATAKKSGRLPEALWVRRFEVYTVLSEPAQEVGTQLALQQDLPAITRAMDALLERMLEERPPRDHADTDAAWREDDSAEPAGVSPTRSSSAEPPGVSPTRSSSGFAPGVKPLSKGERLTLQDILARADSPAGTLWLDAYDGLVAALACGPGLVMPNVWMQALWNGGEPRAASLEDYNRTLTLLMRHHNSVQDSVRAGTFQPLLLDAKGGPAGSLVRWCGGFVRGVEVARTHWDARKNDRQLREMLAPIVQATLKDSEEELAGLAAPGRKLKLRLLRDSVLALRDYWKEWGPSPERSARGPVRHADAPSRNDPCPCGSGKKYKKCCGSGLGVLDMLRADLTWKGPCLNKVEIDALLHADWNDPEGPVRLARDLSDGELERVAMVANAVAYLSALAETDRVQITATGNLKVDLVKRLRDKMVYCRRFDEFSAVRKNAPREPDVQPLLVVRRVCETAGLTETSGMLLSITDLGRECIAVGRNGELYRRLFTAFFKHGALRPVRVTEERETVLRTVAFTLFALNWEMDGWTAPTDLALKVFLPGVHAALSAGQGVHYSFAHHQPQWALEHFVLAPLEEFGLVECRFGSGKESWKIAEVRKTELFDRFLRFGVPMGE